MIILNEISRPHIIDSLNSPLVLRHHWIFDAHMLDFALSEINYLEEIQGPTITLRIDGCDVMVPGSWNIMIVDKETYTVDMVPVTSCAAFEHQAFVFSPADGKIITETIQVSNWDPKGLCVTPAVEKATALIHAISDGVLHFKQIPRGVIIGPHDLHRWIGSKTVGDLLG